MTAMRRIRLDTWERMYLTISIFMRLKAYYCSFERCDSQCTEEQKAKCHELFRQIAEDAQYCINGPSR